MRILISVDMEGIAGIAVTDDVKLGTPDYQRGRHLMTGEASAAVRGALRHSPTADVVVVDAHSMATNLIPEELDKRARLIRGRPRPLGMVTGLEGSNAAIFIGYHGRAGTMNSVLSHTISSACVADIRCQGRSLGEIGLNAALAAELNVPLVLVSGDDTVAREATELLPGVRAVVVKEGLGQNAALSLHAEEACLRIEEAVPEALEQRAQVGHLRFQGEVELEVQFHREVMVEPGILVPGVRRIGPVTLAYTAPSFRCAHDMSRLLSQLAGTTL